MTGERTNVVRAFKAQHEAVQQALGAIEGGDDNWREVARAALPAMTEFRHALQDYAQELARPLPPAPPRKPWWRRLLGRS